MKRYIIALIIAATPTLASAWTTKEINDTVDQTNFLVNRGCSGTLVSKAEGYILTAAHCVDDQYEIVKHDEIDKDGKVKEVKIRVARPGTVTQKFFAGPNEIQQNSYVYKIVATDTALDLALLKVQTKLPQTIEAQMACVSPARAETVYAVGNSFAILYSTLTKGIVSSVQRNYRDLRIAGDLGDLTDLGEHGLIQHSAPIAPGNSGGALFNEAGKFVGVNVRGAPGGGFSFAVPQEDVMKFFKSNNISVTCNG